MIKNIKLSLNCLLNKQTIHCIYLYLISRTKQGCPLKPPEAEGTLETKMSYSILKEVVATPLPDGRVILFTRGKSSNDTRPIGWDYLQRPYANLEAARGWVERCYEHTRTVRGGSPDCPARIQKMAKNLRLISREEAIQLYPWFEHYNADKWEAEEKAREAKREALWLKLKQEAATPQ